LGNAAKTAADSRGCRRKSSALKLAHSAKGTQPYRKACRSKGIKVAAPPLDSHCDGPVTYPGDTKILVKSSKGKSGPTLSSYDNNATK